jgi:uncharacterized protein
MAVKRWLVMSQVLLGLGAAAACRPPTTIVHASAAEPVHGLSVIGFGEVKAAPDVARTSLGVEMRAETAEQATAQANERMTAILAALKGLGIAERDLRTHGFSVSFEREPPPPPMPEPGPGRTPAQPQAQPAQPKGFYRVSNVVEVTIRDLGKVGQVLGAATQAGANNVWGISFELDDPRPLLADARARAVEHARQNAQSLATLAGVKLGQVVSVSESSSQPGPPRPMMAMKAEAAQDVPVERGEVTVTHQVQMVYSLADAAPGQNAP